MRVAEVIVVDVRSDKARIGVAAPKEVRVHRQNVYNAIRRENESAMTLSAGDMAGVATRSD